MSVIILNILCIPSLFPEKNNFFCFYEKETGSNVLSWLGRHQVLLCPSSGRCLTSETLIESLLHSRNSLAFSLVASGCGSWDV